MIPDSSDFRLVATVTAPFWASEGEKGDEREGYVLFVSEQNVLGRMQSNCSFCLCCDEKVGEGDYGVEGGIGRNGTKEKQGVGLTCKQTGRLTARQTTRLPNCQLIQSINFAVLYCLNSCL